MMVFPNDAEKLLEADVGWWFVAEMQKRGGDVFRARFTVGVQVFSISTFLFVF